MIRAIGSLFAGLGSALLVDFAVWEAVKISSGYPWYSGGFQYWLPWWFYANLFGVLLAGLVGGLVASRVAAKRRLLHSLIASVPGLASAYNFWSWGDSPLWIIALALCGIAGAIAGGLITLRIRVHQDRPAAVAADG